MRYSLLFAFIGTVFAFICMFHVFPVHAASIGGTDVANVYPIADTKAADGDVMVNTLNGFVRATVPYDNSIFGVYATNPLIVVWSGDTSAKPIVRSGMANVNVTTANGAIKSGDYLTSSTVPGKAEKADQSGYVLGIALADFPGTGASASATQGTIPAAIKIEYAELTTARNANRLFEYLGAALATNIKDPEKFGTTVRYVLAGLVLLASFAFAFVTFSRALPKGVEAIGRNPLAKNTIYLSMVLNVGLVVIVGVLGIVGAILIIRF